MKKGHDEIIRQSKPWNLSPLVTWAKLRTHSQNQRSMTKASSRQMVMSHRY